MGGGRIDSLTLTSQLSTSTEAVLNKNPLSFMELPVSRINRSVAMALPPIMKCGIPSFHQSYTSGGMKLC